jgi:adenosylhomocysteine nucleosidase
MIVITFAVPHESRALVAALHHSSPAPPPDGGAYVIGNIGREEVLIFHTGIGCAAVAKTLPHVLAREKPSWLLSAGFAGALDPSLRVGDLVAEESHSARGLLARVPAGIRRAAITTEDVPAATPEGKRAVRERTGAAAVDMESRAIAAACAAAQVPLLILRVISDDAETTLPLDFATTWDSENQRPRIPAIIRSLANRPVSWLPFASFLRDLDLASSRLAEGIGAVVE